MPLLVGLCRPEDNVQEEKYQETRQVDGADALQQPVTQAMRGPAQNSHP